MYIPNTKFIIDQNPVSIKFLQKQLQYSNLLDFDSTQPTNFVLIVQEIQLVDNILQLFVTDLNNDIRLTIKDPTPKLKLLEPKQIIFSKDTFICQIPIRNLVTLQNYSKNIILLGKSVNTHKCDECSRQINQKETFCSMHMRSLIKARGMVIGSVDKVVHQVMLTSQRVDLSGGLFLKHEDEILPEPVNKVDFMLQKLQKMREKKVVQKESEFKHLIQKHVPEIQIEPKRQKVQPNTKSQCFFCVQCNKVTLTFNQVCKQKGHQQVMKMAKHVVQKCSQCSYIVTNIIRAERCPICGADLK